MNSEHENSGADVSSAQSHTLPAAPVGFEQRANLPFTVVGIGASAGGIPALSSFFRAAPADAGMSYVVIQHLPPEHTSVMPEILGRCTSMRVAQVSDGMPIEPDCIYVIRPGFTVTLSGGVLHLGEPVEARGHRRPVDDFFRSLAVEQKEKAIIVVLSGTGTNGTAGAQAVKAAGGLCIAQDPESAEFPGMPNSLIHSGYADEVLAADQIPAFLTRYVRHPAVDLETAAAGQLDPERGAIGEIHALLRVRTGHDFRGYRKPTVMRRIDRRMSVVGSMTLADYARVLRNRNDEALTLANDLMINVTGFFRDPEAWEALGEVAIHIVASQVAGTPLRAWVTACASGEEPYSLAMLIAEECERQGKPFEAKIFATDTAEKSLSLARAGIYPGGIEGDISQQRLERFFDKDEHTYRVKKELREAVVFAPHNLLRDPPFSRVDICSCRNFLIYLEPATQARIMSMLSFAVRNGGYLLLGNTESLGAADQEFETVSKRWRIFRRVGPLQHRWEGMVPANFVAADARARDDQRKQTSRPQPASRDERSTSSFERALLEEFGPPTVIINRQERVLFIHGEIAPFMSLPSGELSTGIVEMTRPPLRAPLRAALRKATVTNVASSVDAPLNQDGDRLWVRVTAAPLSETSGARNTRVSFEMRPAPDAMAPRVDAEAAADKPPVLLPVDMELEDEVRGLRRELQAGIEAFEASNEELKSANEEVLSVNEELQSANEELETGKEEAQSINEELTTLNVQLQFKIAELEQTTNDLSNLLGSTSVAVVFLDTELRVRRFTPAIQDLIELIPTDIGRPISDLSPKFSTVEGYASAHEALRNTAQGVLQNLVPQEMEVRSHNGSWYLQRTLPYRTTDNHIAGVVVTFVDITRRRAAEQALAHVQDRLEAALEYTPAAILVVDPLTSVVLHANRRAATIFGQSYPPPFLNTKWDSAVGAMKGWNPEGRLLEAHEWPVARSLKTGECIAGEQIEIGVGDQRRVLSVSSQPASNAAGEPVAVVGAFWDITDLKMAERALRDSERRLRLIFESAQDFAIVMFDSNGRITAWNAGAHRMFGWEEHEIAGQTGDVIFTVSDRAAGVPQQEMRTALREGRAMDDRWHLRRDGTTLWVNGVLSVARDEAGQVVGFVKIVRDNTNRKEAEERLYALTQESAVAQARAEAANQSKDDFISMVSHELRTPLNTMRLWMRLLRNEALPGKDRAEGQRVLERAIDAQQQLIDDLLDVSRISAGKLGLDLRPTRLAEAIGAAVEAVRPVSDRKGVRITYRASPDVGVVKADPDRLQQVVWNLLSNAVKFTPSGGQVLLEVERDGGAVTIKVTDTGIGIREDLLPYIFDRFQQGESGTARQHTGLGLGLAIAKQLVELHQGAISASSEGSGRGACFMVTLPLVNERIEVEHTRRVLPGDSALFPGLRILLVEDEGSTRDAARRLLISAQAEVQAVESAAAGRDAYLVARPDLIISDIGMPGEDGYRLMTEIRALEAERGLSRVPALALTAFAREEDRKRCLEAGFDAHMAKPLDPDRLFEQVARLAGRRGIGAG